jgi:DNA-binding CsgD family transcriptional regulator
LSLGRPDDAATDLEYVFANGAVHERAFAACLRSAIDGNVPPMLEIAAAGTYVDQAVYHAALAHYRFDRHGSAKAMLEGHAPSSPAEKARYLLLRGAASAGEDDFLSQADDAAEALRILLPIDPEETYLVAFACYQIAALARELPRLPDFEHLARIERKLAWTDELNTFRFQLLRTLGWRAMIVKNPLSLKHFARAAFYATTPTLRAFAHLDRAEAAAAAGEPYSAEVERAMAVELLEAISWEGVHDESIAVLPTAARVLAGGAYSEAEKYAELADTLVGQFTKSLAFAHGPRFRALINEGIAYAFASSDPSRAIEAGRLAYGVFETIDYSWRACRIAGHLYALTGQAPWQERSALQARRYPRNIPLLRSDKPLTPRQQDIAKRLCAGETIEHIADAHHVSTSTIKTLAQRMYSRYSVRGREQFVRAYREQFVRVLRAG